MLICMSISPYPLGTCLLWLSLWYSKYIYIFACTCSRLKVSSEKPSARVRRVSTTSTGLIAAEFLPCCSAAVSAQVCRLVQTGHWASGTGTYVWYSYSSKLPSPAKWPIRSPVPTSKPNTIWFWVIGTVHVTAMQMISRPCLSFIFPLTELHIKISKVMIMAHGHKHCFHGVHL